MSASQNPEMSAAKMRAAAVVAVLALVCVVGALAVAPWASAASSSGRVAADPTDSTAPVGPTAPGSSNGSVVDTGPVSSVPSPDVSDGDPATTLESSGSGQNGAGGESQSAGQGSASSVAVYSAADNGSTMTTTPPMTTTENLLEGPSTTEGTTTTSTTLAAGLTGSSVTHTGGSSDPTIWAIVGGLVAVALGLGVATVLYWRRTRPTGGEAPESGVGRRGGSRGRSRYADLVVTSPEPL